MSTLTDVLKGSTHANPQRATLVRTCQDIRAQRLLEDLKARYRLRKWDLPVT